MKSRNLALLSVLFLPLICFAPACDSSGNASSNDVQSNDTLDGSDDVLSNDTLEDSSNQGNDQSTNSTDLSQHDQCVKVCPLVVAAGCSQGPPDIDSCVMGCDVMFAQCTQPMEDFMTCVGSDPFMCTVSGDPTVLGCEDEATALYDCQNSL